MDEEKMWKNFYEKLQETNMNPQTEHECKLQDADGGFFEKFGSLLRQQSQLEENDLKTSLAPFNEDAVAEEDIKESDENVDSSGSNEEIDCSAIGQLELELELEPEPDFDLSEVKERKEKLFEKSAGMNVSFN